MIIIIIDLRYYIFTYICGHVFIIVYVERYGVGLEAKTETNGHTR